MHSKVSHLELAAEPAVSPSNVTPLVPLATLNAPSANTPGEEFDAVVQTLREVALRREVCYEELPAPTKLAPYAWAISADVLANPDDDEEIGNGRFVLLHDPKGHETWGSKFRVVTFVRTNGEVYMSGEDLAEVGWSWVRDGLDRLKTEAILPSCTITEVRSTSFGHLEDRDLSVEIEMRASWSPINGEHLDEHLETWSRIMCSFAGLPPESESIVTLHRPR